MAMLSTHFVLIGTNQTTVEHVAARSIKDREQDALDERYSFWAFRSVLFFPPSIPALGVLVLIKLVCGTFQGKAAYAKGVGCRVWAPRTRG